jgi:hypothetical protein
MAASLDFLGEVEVRGLVDVTARFGLCQKMSIPMEAKGQTALHSDRRVCAGGKGNGASNDR